jgi:phage-related baseplate assembly protein
MLNRASFIGEVQNRVAKAFALSRAELLSRSRKREVASARQIAMYLSRDLAKSAAYGASSVGWALFPRIGMAFSRDHSSVIHACNVVSQRRAVDDSFVELLDELRRDLRQHDSFPTGSQIGTADGQYIFATSPPLTFSPGMSAASVEASALTAGPGANGYLSGQISVQMNPSVPVQSVTNTSVSAGGTAPESDDHLRGRIQAAPNQFSVAGPAGAYRFFALSASSSIIDAQVSSPAPGQVSVYVLTWPINQQPAATPNNAGVASPALLSMILTQLNADNVRPLTDTVNVLPVVEIDYQITGTIILYSDADPVSTMAAATSAAQELAIALASRIQRDIVPSQMIEALSVSGVYEVVLTAPTYVPLTAGQWANCTSIALSQATGPIHS